MATVLHSVQFKDSADEYLDGGTIALKPSLESNRTGDLFDGEYMRPVSLTALNEHVLSYELAFGGENEAVSVLVRGKTTVDPVAGHVLIGTIERGDKVSKRFMCRLIRFDG
jgi:hypothetical protein